MKQHTVPGAPLAQAFQNLRLRMVEDQLRRRGITDYRVLRAMSDVPREEFVPGNSRDAAYDDCPLPIGCGQTISQPFTVAFMCQALQLTGNERVLEIGTGSGYGAAVLSQLAAAVYSVERISELATSAQNRLARLGFQNVHVRTANGTLGWPEEAPFDGIVVTAGAETLPDAYVSQLAPEGRIVIPLGPYPCSQTMYRFTKRGAELQTEDLGGFAFVPLIGKYGWSDRHVTQGEW